MVLIQAICITFFTVFVFNITICVSGVVFSAINGAQALYFGALEKGHFGALVLAPRPSPNYLSDRKCNLNVTFKGPCLSTKSTAPNLHFTTLLMT